MLSRFFIAFPQGARVFLTLWLQSPSTVVLEPKNIKSAAVSTFSLSVCHEVMRLVAMILVFWILSFKPAFSLPSFTLMIHTVKGFCVVNKAEIDVFLHPCSFNDPMDVGNLISGPSDFPKLSLSIWKVSAHVLLKPAAAAAAKSLQSCPTLCDPTDGSAPGSPVPGILQARTLKWVAISFSNAWKWKVKVKSFSHGQLSATPWTTAYQAPSSMGFSRQEYWSGLPLPSSLAWRILSITLLAQEMTESYF